MPDWSQFDDANQLRIAGARHQLEVAQTRLLELYDSVSGAGDSKVLHFAEKYQTELPPQFHKLLVVVAETEAINRKTCLIELQTALAGIGGALELLKDFTDPPEDKEDE